jgi:pyridoxine/pyridoxamine 5'-phosphate oxidase
MNTTNPFSLHRQWIEEDMSTECEAVEAFDLAVANGELVLGEDGYFYPAT